MTRAFLRRATLAFTAFVFLLTLSSAAPAQQDIAIWSANWGLALSQNLRICINASSSKASESVETGSIEVNLTNLAGLVVKGPELRVPDAGFQCHDITYAALVDAGFQPDRATGALTFLVQLRRSVTLGASQTLSVGANQSITTGAIENIFTDSGRIDLYQRLELGR
jgi:hypothetical protein